MGGNLGNVKRTLQSAQQLINDRVGAILHCSHRYESEAWGFSSADHFFNQAVEVSTDLSPEEILNTIQAIEQELGRDRAQESREKELTGARYASRAIDIDILFYDDLILQSDRLTIPHPHIAEREFVLTPLREITHTKHHPSTGLSIDEMLQALRDKSNQ